MVIPKFYQFSRSFCNLPAFFPDIMPEGNERLPDAGVICAGRGGIATASRIPFNHEFAAAAARGAGRRRAR
jgi:hypothetical protein